MTKSRIALLASSGLVILVVLGGGWFVRIGAADNTYNQVMLFSDVLSLVSEYYVDPVEPGTLVEGAYESMMASLDPRGAFLTPEEAREWTAGKKDETAGPGVSVLKAYGLLQVVTVHSGSPAEAAGLTIGDQIRKIDGRDLSDLSWDQCLSLLRGEPGSVVRLEVVHPDETFRLEEVDLVRKKRADPAYDLRVRDGIGVLSVRDLSRIDSGKVASDLEDVASRGVTRLLLDLRNAVDGTPRDAARLAAVFHPGSAFRLRDRRGKISETVEAPAPLHAWRGAIGVLVNGATAGGAEGLARLLQVSGGARVFGESSFGLGTEVELFKMPDGSAVVVPTSRWELAGGEGWTPDGVKPDRVLRPRGRDVAARMEDQLEQAIGAFAEALDAVAPPAREAA